MITDDLSWNADSLSDALTSLAHAAGLAPRAVTAGAPPSGERDRWLDAVANAAGFEVEPVECTVSELAGTLAAIGPALVVLPGARALAVLRSAGGRVHVITPTLARAEIPLAVVAQALAAHLTAAPAARVEAWLAAAKVTPRQAARARPALLEHLVGEQRVSGVWLLRADPGSSFWAQLRRQGCRGLAGWFLAAALAQVVLSMIGWALVGRISLTGVVDRGWVSLWVLVTLSGIPVQLASMRLGARLGLEVALVLKQRLLTGALRLDPDAIRTEGSGRLLAMVAESAAIEGAGLGGAFGALVALLQLVLAGVLLAFGAGGVLHVLLLAAWSLVLAVLVARAHRQRTSWTAERLALTNGFVENVVGNRTRIAQQAESEWHRREDEHVARYAVSSRELDGQEALLAALPARGWLLVSLAGLVPAVLAHAKVGELAITIGGILQAQTALGALVASATALLGGHVAWRSVGRLFHAAADVPAAGLPAAAVAEPARLASVAAGRPVVVLDAQGVSFRYRAAGEPVLRDCALTIRDGDRVLIEGRSGGGKSTLASLLVGQRTPESGHILLRGLDAATLGARGFRQRVASAPQFHENHILSGTLLFNLLMGRAWPGVAADRREAESVCRELGLGPLLERMPSGLDQVVGETGWQLSHGERSRVFLARALLQRADVVILDETFGALDPLTLRTCVATALARAPALIAIAHP